MLVVRKPGASNPAGYRDFRVRKTKVLDFLKYLNAHNPFYANIMIRPTEQIDLPIDGSILECLPQVHSTFEERGGADCDDVRAASSTNDSSFVSDSLSEEHNVFVPGFCHKAYEIDTIEDGMQEFRIKTADSEPVPWSVTQICCLHIKSVLPVLYGSEVKLLVIVLDCFSVLSNYIVFSSLLYACREPLQTSVGPVGTCVLAP